MHKKTMLSLTTILLLLGTISSAVILPEANAADYQNYAFITVSPNPVGVGEKVLAVFFLSVPPPTGVAGFGATTNFDNYTVKVTSPSGKVETFGPFTSDATGGAFMSYTPDQVGQYKFDFTWPGQTLSGVGLFGLPTGPFTYSPASATTNLTVQQEPVPNYQTPPLPTDYWTRPIYAENRGWYQIAGNWLRNCYNATGPFNPYTTAPNTAHIVWMREQYLGGVVGGEYGDLNYYLAPTYQDYWAPPLIISGRLYYMQRQDPGSGWVGLHCVDIRTGKELWFQDVSVIGSAGAGGGGSVPTIYGQILDAEGPNGHGAEAFIWNLGMANWTVFDANSGRLAYTISNPLVAPATFAFIPGPSGPVLFNGGLDSAGSMIAYYLDASNHWLLKWNSTKLLASLAALGGGVYIVPYGQTVDWKYGIQWNVTVPAHAGVEAGFFNGAPPSDGNVLYAVTSDIATPSDNFTLIAYDANTGGELWTSMFSDVFVKGSTLWEFFGPVKNGVVTVYDKNTERWWGFDEYTGQKLWGPTDPFKSAWDTEINAVVAYGNLYVGTYGGHIYAFNLKTGDLEWTYSLPSSGHETPYGTYPLSANTILPSSGMTVADGKLYAVTGEHTPNSPYWLGGSMYVVNATTGDEITRMPGWWSDQPAIADGYVLDLNCLDGAIYCFNKGQTAITVTAPSTVMELGQSLEITGIIMDQSPGVIDYAGNRVSTEGSPAIADAYMTPWMAYLYQQKPEPANATGVQVTLSVIDANGNYRPIGTVTSDIAGAFHYMWKPDIPGEYTLIASFAGSESYYSSSAETAFAVSEAPAASPTPTPTPVSVAEQYFVPMSIGMIAAIIVVIALLAIILLRKRA
jgi:outer membrane protein assembly factor BamB